MSEQSPNPGQDPTFAQNFIDNIMAVTEYNRRHTGVGSAARSMVDMIMSQQEGYEQPEVTRGEEAEIEKETVQFLHTDELASLGVSVFDSSANVLRQVSDEELLDVDRQPATLILLVTDGEKFGEAIDNLKPAPEQEDQVSNGVDMLLRQTASLIKAGYDVTAESDEHGQYALRQIVDQQLDMFISLTPTLYERGYGELPNYQALSEYSARYATGQLADYIGAESLGLLHSGFGPSEWQKDTTAEQLAQRWNKAFGYLLKLRDSDEPSAYYSELFTELRGDFDKGQAWLEDSQADEHRPNYPGDYIEALKSEMTELSTIWDSQFMLENTMYLTQRQDT